MFVTFLVVLLLIFYSLYVRIIHLISAEINRRRLQPGMPNDALINTVTVSSPSTDVYTVTLNPFDCGNQFPLFELTHGTVSYLNFPANLYG